ncbi:MAG TPA: hypothetical protein VKG84_10900 [Candidatus Acidoferrales bacterium]|nr:hypothetical protein [Candidatus Acidoferrales bacterium]
MKTPQAWAPLLAVLAVGLSVRAGDSWLNKPCTEWNEKEVRTVLEKSPWAHRERMMVVKAGRENIPCPSGNLHCSTADDSNMNVPAAPNVRRRGMSPDDLEGLDQRRTASAMPSGLDGVAGTAVVRWASARTVREAMERKAMKDAKPAAAQAELPASSPPDSYVVYVDLRVALVDIKRVPQGGVLTATMVRNSSLLMKSTGVRLAPWRVTPAPLPEFDDRREMVLAAYYVYFPRKKDGEPLLSDSETLVRFECPLTPLPIISEFDPRTMKRSGVPDL